MDDFYTEDAKQVFARIMQAAGSVQSLSKPVSKRTTPTPPAKAVSTKSFNSNTLARMEAQIARRNRQVSKELQKKIQQEESAHTYRPKINAYSKQLARGELPLHQRISRILEEKQEHIQALETQVKARDREEGQQLTFRPQLQHKAGQRHRSFDAVYKDLSSWDKQRTEKQEKLRELKQADTVIEPKPQINKNSSQMAKQIVPFEQRLQKSVQQWQQRKTSQGTTHSFSPAITDKAKALRFDQRVFERLAGASGPSAPKLFSESSKEDIINLLADI